ncbi:MAG: hypothetical protein P8L79_11035 [Rhodospirillaceae bacterium]|jgi:hypothetical protein|nr:hypothetical protein [Rhodospirillaceae bacterium]
MDTFPLSIYLRQTFCGYDLVIGFNDLAINRKGGELHALLQVGDDSLLLAEVYHPPTSFCPSLT